MAPASPPDGFITKQQISQLYPVSERTVQRHISTLVRSQELSALAHLTLVTDEKSHPGMEVTTELIDALNRNGQKPRWYIRPSYAEETFGAKPEPEPVTPSQPNIPPRPPEEGSHQSASSATPVVEVVSLRERLVAMEREREEERKRYQEDRARHDRIVAKLFEQLDVKDKQISAWDEVTQGLTKALATGQLTPDLSRLQIPQKNTTDASARNETVVDADTVATPAETNRIKTTPPSPPSRAFAKSPSRKKAQRKGKRSRSKSTTAKQPSPPKSSKPKPEPKWWETPTLNRFLGRQSGK